MKNVARLLIVGSVVASIIGFSGIAFAGTSCDPTNPGYTGPCSNGPIVPFPPGWTYVPRGTDITATPDNCPKWYGLAGCMRRPN